MRAGLWADSSHSLVELLSDADVWADTPGRLVVITCLQRPDGKPSTENMVVEASRVV